VFGCLAAPARADLSDEIQVYADDINAAGQFHLELHLNTTPSGRSTPGRNHSGAWNPPDSGIQVTDWAALGLEYYADLGPITDIKPYGRQMRTLYVAIDVDRAPWAFNFGIGRGLSQETDAWTIKMIFEIPID
jgi:hypothetical protein